MLKKATVLLMVVVMLSTVLAACSGTPTEQPPETPPVADLPAETETPVADEAAHSHYPVTITTYNYVGEEITTVYENAPEKVLAVYQGSIETLLALGLEDRIIACAGLDNEVADEYKKAFAKLKYLDEFTPSKETVISLQPDMVLSWGSIFDDKRLGDVDYWIESGCNTYTNTRTGGYDRTLDNEFTDILNLGKIFDVEEKAQAIVDAMKKEIADAQEKAATQFDKKRVLVIEFLSDIRNYGANSLGGDMVLSLGAELAMTDGTSLGKEDIIALDPDLIFVVYMAYSGEDGEDVKQTMLGKVLDDPAFSSMSAVQNEQIYPIMLGDMYASGIRTHDGIINFSAGIYGE